MSPRDTMLRPGPWVAWQRQRAHSDWQLFNAGELLQQSPWAPKAATVRGELWWLRWASGAGWIGKGGDGL